MSAIVSLALKEAQKNGYSYATLQADSESLGLCEKAGFQPAVPYEVFLSPKP